MSEVPQVGVDVSGRVILPYELQQQIEAAGIPMPRGLTLQGPSGPLRDPSDITQPQGARVFTHDDQGEPCDLPPGADEIVANYVPSVNP